MLTNQTVELLPARTTMHSHRSTTVNIFFVFAENVGTVGTNNGLSIGSVVFSHHR